MIMQLCFSVVDSEGNETRELHISCHWRGYTHVDDSVCSLVEINMIRESTCMWSTAFSSTESPYAKIFNYTLCRVYTRYYYGWQILEWAIISHQVMKLQGQVLLSIVSIVNIELLLFVLCMYICYDNYT